MPVKDCDRLPTPAREDQKGKIRAVTVSFKHMPAVIRGSNYESFTRSVVSMRGAWRLSTVLKTLEVEPRQRETAVYYIAELVGDGGSTRFSCCNSRLLQSINSESIMAGRRSLISRSTSHVSAGIWLISAEIV